MEEGSGIVGHNSVSWKKQGFVFLKKKNIKAYKHWEKHRNIRHVLFQWGWVFKESLGTDTKNRLALFPSLDLDLYLD